MAKAKKPAASTSKTSALKKKSTTPNTGDAPMIDTAQAAVAAANFIKARTGNSPSAAPEKESGGFKTLRDSLNKPAAGSMTQFLNQTSTPGQKKTGAPQFGGKQVGRNQTFGADVNRAGVPRRTGGG